MDFRKYHTVTKLWGQEIWLVNNDRYCAKILVIVPGFECSKHMHPIKKETFFILDGVLALETWDENDCRNIELLGEGESKTLEPCTYHRFSSGWDNPTMILEISSTHSDEDVVRMEDSRAL